MSLYRGYRIEALGTFPMFKVQAVGSGQIPVALYGSYTTVTMAERAVDQFLASLVKSRKVKDAPQEDTSTD